jgi:predicted membrane protein
MNEEDFKKRVRERWGHRRYGRGGRQWSGVFLLIIGGLLLARASGVLFPAWFFSGPVLLIGIGLFIGVRHRFRNFVWLIPIVIGGALLADRLSPDITLRPYIWPVLLIGAGLFFIFRPKGRHCRRGGGRDDNSFTDEQVVATSTDTDALTPGISSQNDMIDVTAVFGGVKKNVVSKDFKGGDVTAFMGGAEINLTQADFKGRVMIDSFNMFGGTKLIVPPDWEVQSGIVAVFGGVDDKRPPSANVHPDKILYLDGTCIFGGVEIKSY